MREFKLTVKTLQAAGLEVLLDVAPNHTCEGNHQGPMLSWKGLDNCASYWLQDADRSKYRDFTGCGNSLNLGNPWALKLVLDSLRHWVTEFHVDGFRFELATTLARAGNGDFSAASPFLQAIHQDPVLSRVKLIAEPWDLGAEGYRLGQYPPLFAEWNDRYRDSIRHFWKGDLWQAVGGRHRHGAPARRPDLRQRRALHLAVALGRGAQAHAGPDGARVRDTWHRNATRLRRELAIAREEQLRLRRVIDDERLEHRRQLKKLKKG